MTPTSDRRPSGGSVWCRADRHQIGGPPGRTRGPLRRRERRRRAGERLRTAPLACERGAAACQATLDSRSGRPLQAAERQAGVAGGCGGARRCARGGTRKRVRRPCQGGHRGTAVGACAARGGVGSALFLGPVVRVRRGAALMQMPSWRNAGTRGAKVRIAVQMRMRGCRRYRRDAMQHRCACHALQGQGKQHDPDEDVSQHGEMICQRRAATHEPTMPPAPLPEQKPSAAKQAWRLRSDYGFVISARRFCAIVARHETADR